MVTSQHDRPETDDEDADAERRFQLASNGARNISHQCHAHARRLMQKFSDLIEEPPASSPCAQDKERALAGDHRDLFGQRLFHLEARGNALIEHLAGVEQLLSADLILPLAALPIARSVTEISASVAWELAADVNSDQRAARSSATVFRSLQNAIDELGPENAGRVVEVREAFVALLQGQGYRVVRREKAGVAYGDVAQVWVGREHAKPNFQISQRVEQQIPSVGPIYGGLSSLAHGDTSFLSATYDHPDMVPRALGDVVGRSVEVWSRAMHEWTGKHVPRFINDRDRLALRLSVPSSHRS